MAGLLNLTPIGDLTSLRNSLLGSSGGTYSGIKSLAVELVQTATCTELRLAIPGGFTEEHIGFAVYGNKLVVYAPREWAERVEGMTEEMKGTGSTHHTGEMRATGRTGERSTMHKEGMSSDYVGDTWYREFEFPMPIDVSQFGVSFEEGYLKICLPLSLGIKPENIGLYDISGKKESFG
jgi:HSP20 family molecular chaperone IbpA